MLSRLSSVRALTKDISKVCIRPIATSQANQSQDGPERDLKNFPRPVRAETSPKVRLGFLPDDWFTFFYKKTGVTGPYVLGVTLSTYLLSKEIYVLEHEFYTGVSILIMLVVATKKLGPSIAASLDKNIDKLKDEMDFGRNQQIEDLQNAIKDQEKALWQAEGQKLLIEAKRENVLLQLEAAYRERLMKAYTSVKKRLDYQVEKENIERRISQKNLVDWVVQNVLKSITPQQEKDTLAKCVADLNGLATRS